MVMKTEPAPASAPASAAAPDDLEKLAREADLLDTSAPAAPGAAVQPEVVLSTEEELFGTLQAVREMTFPMLAVAVGARRMDELAEVWRDQVLEKAASAGARVLELHGMSVGSMMGRYAPYVMLVAALAPPVLATKKILTPPKAPEKKPGEGAPNGSASQ